MKPEKIPEEWVWCPTCNKKYGFLNPRVSTFPQGNRKEQCLTCGVLDERKKAAQGDSQATSA